MAHGTAPANSLRTIAGFAGIASFVGIMTSVTAVLQAEYGAKASMHGFNIAFLIMGAVTCALLCMGIAGIKSPVVKSSQ